MHPRIVAQRTAIAQASLVESLAKISEIALLPAEDVELIEAGLHDKNRELRNLRVVEGMAIVAQHLLDILSLEKVEPNIKPPHFEVPPGEPEPIPVEPKPGRGRPKK